MTSHFFIAFNFPPFFCNVRQSHQLSLGRFINVKKNVQCREYLIPEMKKIYTNVEVGCRVSMMAYEEPTVNELTQRETLIVISNKTTTLYEITRRIFFNPTSILFFPSCCMPHLSSSILSKKLFFCLLS